MEVALAVLWLLTVVSYSSADGACRVDGQQCFDDLVKSFKMSQEEKKEVFCGKLKNSVDCITEFAETCINDPKLKIPQEIIDQLINNANTICSCKSDDSDLDNNGIPDEKKKANSCVRDSRKILSYSGECAEKLKEHLKSNIAWEKNGNRDSGTEICLNYLDVCKCVSKKMGEDCGEHAEKPFFAEMMKQMKDAEPTGATSPKCAKVIEEAEEYLSSLQHNTR